MTHTFSNGSIWTVGFDSVFDRLESIQQQKQSYPPHNIVKHDEDNFEIALAIAGFSENDVSIDLQDQVLTVESKEVDLNGNKEYIHKGIATRKFKRQWTLGQYIEVDKASIKDGILSIFLKRELPEEKKPRKILINTDKELLTE